MSEYLVIGYSIGDNFPMCIKIGSNLYRFTRSEFEDEQMLQRFNLKKGDIQNGQDLSICPLGRNQYWRLDELTMFSLKH